jgi:hypothetical protein
VLVELVPGGPVLCDGVAYTVAVTNSWAEDVRVYVRVYNDDLTSQRLHDSRVAAGGERLFRGESGCRKGVGPHEFRACFARRGCECSWPQPRTGR